MAVKVFYLNPHGFVELTVPYGPIALATADVCRAPSQGESRIIRVTRTRILFPSPQWTENNSKFLRDMDRPDADRPVSTCSDAMLRQGSQNHAELSG